jgi:type IV secretion system protein TrbH
MRHAACSLLCGFVLAGCATPPAPYGNFIGQAPVGYHRTIVEDAAQQLAAIYPPAATRFEVQQATPDAFGRLLMATLRAKGYAVREAGPASAAQGAPAVTDANAAAAASPVLQLRYVVDRPAELVRITLMIGDQSLTRAYLAQNEALRPAGAWVRKE